MLKWLQRFIKQVIKKTSGIKIVVSVVTYEKVSHPLRIKIKIDPNNSILTAVKKAISTAIKIQPSAHITCEIKTIQKD